ncbi:MAG: hypothetical protein KJ583_02565 [Nanoarchaeota archaeon]|nr:hypothetical protein [Nanoarchaeota archaeon]MBU1269936.1 hypothetical protein [Nanoarchaeota archaeon]MBU1604177.1 hypothetical protein [Nanoarchaeota archaeon]MBU2443078.1 hypothetical protein [Nanoarchaeota archaeon]
MNKRGDEKLSKKLTFYAFIFILVAIVILSVFRFIGNTLDDTTFWRGYYAKDAGLMISAGETGRGVFELSYNTKKAEKPLVFNLKINNEVEIYDHDPNAKTKQSSTFKFIGDKKIKIEPAEIISTFFNIYIDDKKVNASKEAIKKDSCPSIDTKATLISNIKIYVDSDDKFKNFENLLINDLKISGFKIANSKYESDIDLALILANSSTNTLSFFYEHTPRKSEKISCIIKNKLVEKYPDKYSYYKINKIDYNSKWWFALSKSNVGLVFEINELTDDAILLIGDSVEEYYG